MYHVTIPTFKLACGLGCQVIAILDHKVYSFLSHLVELLCDCEILVCYDLEEDSYDDIPAQLLHWSKICEQMSPIRCGESSGGCERFPLASGSFESCACVSGLKCLFETSGKCIMQIWSVVFSDSFLKFYAFIRKQSITRGELWLFKQVAKNLLFFGSHFEFCWVIFFMTN